MIYILDSSTVFKWVVTELDSDKARRLRDEFRNGVHDLLAPDLLPIELSNALIIAERRGRIGQGESTSLLQDILKTLPRLHAAWPDLLSRAHDISLASGASVYDSLYVALAERESCEFVTADDKLVNKLQPAFPFIVALSSLP